MFYKKEYQKILAERNAWRDYCVARDDEIIKLNRTIRQLKGVCDFLKRDNAKLRTKEPSTFDRMNYQKLKKENAELKERAERAEMKLSARESADKAFKDNCCLGLSFLGETLRELNKQDEEQKRREDFLFRAVEGLAGENTELKRQLGEEPGRAITIDGTRVDSKTKQPEPKKKKT
ncbi:MAG: hypothetical protein Q4D20_09975 [Clostridia bacterium]|nr:hypothetical protein [Clostridia bacterium]